MKKHPGFKAVARRIAAQENIPIKNANAILANSSRHASAEAVRRNRYLKKVSGGYRK